MTEPREPADWPEPIDRDRATYYAGPVDPMLGLALDRRPHLPPSPRRRHEAYDLPCVGCGTPTAPLTPFALRVEECSPHLGGLDAEGNYYRMAPSVVDDLIKRHRHHKRRAPLLRAARGLRPLSAWTG